MPGARPAGHLHKQSLFISISITTNLAQLPAVHHHNVCRPTTLSDCLKECTT